MDGQLHHLQTLLRHVSLCTDTRPDLMTLAVTQKIIDQLSAMHLAPVAVVILISQRCIIPKSIIASLDVDRVFKALEALGDNDDDDDDDGDRDRDHIEESSVMQWMEALRMIHNDSMDHVHSEAAISNVRHLTDHGLYRHSSSQQILAQIGLDLISLLYHIPSSSPSSSASSRRGRRGRLAQLRTEHFNIVLRLAMLAGDHSMVLSLFHLMHPLNDSDDHHDDDDSHEVEAATAAVQEGGLFIGSEGVLTMACSTPSTTTSTTNSTTTTSSTSSRSSDLDYVSSSVDPVFFIPNTFTIAELIRCARVSTDIDLLTRVVVWSVQHMVYVPVGLISDAISMLYRYALFLID